MKYLIAYEKEKKDKLEILVDWLRKLIISKGKTDMNVLTILQTEYVNILNSIGKEYKKYFLAVIFLVLQKDPVFGPLQLNDF